MLFRSAVILSGAYLVFQAITYASLIAAMPRAGGDYVWMSRVLGGGIGFVLAVCGWWFILWHWVPIYANILNVEVIVPLASIIGWDGGVTFFSEDKGLFWASVITAILASILVAVGVRTYARVQKICFYGGLIGLAFMFVLLLVNSKTDFISALNNEGADVLRRAIPSPPKSSKHGPAIPRRGSPAIASRRNGSSAPSSRRP